MRIIRGSHKGKKIVAPSNLPVRPTTDFAKEGLFNILENYFYFDAVTVVDIFAGTGNISYEFAARGAEKVLAVDMLDVCVNFINKTAQLLDFEKLIALKMDALAFLDKSIKAVNIIFADPPFDWDKHHRIPELVFEKNLLLPDGFLIIEHDASIHFKTHPKLYQQRKFGKVNFSIFAENL
jgi:16S rRNA (guanine(966)-N(2))-methyltransferase RsmD